MNCTHAREETAVALLLRQAPAGALREHLDGCGPCRTELEWLTPVPGLLAAADVEVMDALEPAAPAGAALLDRLLAEVARRRGRRRTVVALSAAAAVLAVAAPLGLWLDRGPGSAGGGNDVAGPSASVSRVPVASASARDPGTRVWATVHVSRSYWGSELSFTIGGVAYDTRCRLVVVDRSGRRQTAATWQADDKGPASVRGTVATAPEDIKLVEVVDDASGKALLRLAAGLTAVERVGQDRH